MRVLIVAHEAARRDALTAHVRAAGHEVCTSCAPEQLTVEVQRALADGLEAVVLDVGADQAALRRAIDRARHAAETPLPVLVLLPEHSTWLRDAPPRELLPAIVIFARGAAAAALAGGFERMGARPPLGRGGDASPAPPVAGGLLSFERTRREVSGSGGGIRVTASEASILEALLAGDGAIVTHEDLAEALWGRAIADRHSRAAIRSHVYTLRRKLREVGLEAAVISLLGVGYSLAAGAES